MSVGERPPPPRAPVPIDLRGIPALARFTGSQHVRWVGWKYEWILRGDKPGKWTKVPKQVNGRNAKNNDPSTWHTYVDVWAGVRKFDGVGFMLAGLRGADFAAIDLDKCRDPKSGELLGWVKWLVENVSYSEVTPSGEGVRLLGTVTDIDALHRRKDHPEGGAFELYINAERYITMSGQALNGVDRFGDITRQFNELRALLDAPAPSPGGAPRIELDMLSLPMVELITRGTLEGKPVKRGGAFFRVVKSLCGKGYEFAAVLALLAQHPDGIAGKYQGRLETELQRAWAKLARRRSSVPGPDGLTLPPGFELTDTGLWWQVPKTNGEEPEPIKVCGRFRVLADTADENSDKHGLLLEWEDDRNRLHRWVMPRRLVHSEGNTIAAELEHRGLHCGTSRQAHERLKQFFGAVRIGRHMQCVSRPGWHGHAYVLPNGRVFGGDGLVMQTEHITNMEAYKARGTLTEWQQQIAHYAIGNDRLILSISEGFVPLLLDILNIASGGTHRYGKSRTGKTALLRCAASVWGPGDSEGQLRNWRATDNGLEGVAVEHCDGLLPLDETSQADANILGATIYMLANQSGKTRANRVGGTTQTQTWRVWVISSGEDPIATKVAEARKRLSAGAEVRLLNIPADALAGMGVWQELHGLLDGAALSDHLRRAASRCCGVAGAAFLEKLVKERHNNHDELVAGLRGSIDAFLQQCLPAGADGQVRSACECFGLIAAAGELGVQYGVLPWPQGEALRASGACFKLWLRRRGGAEAAEDIAAVKAVRCFLALHGAQGSTRFEEADEPQQQVNKWQEPRIMNRAGYVRERIGVKEFLIFETVWEQEVCRGLDPQNVARVLRDKGFLFADPGRLKIQVRVRGHTERIRFYGVSATILEGADE
jgi:uncharacterized protein (DUF927 family)